MYYNVINQRNQMGWNLNCVYGRIMSLSIKYIEFIIFLYFIIYLFFSQAII